MIKVQIDPDELSWEAVEELERATSFSTMREWLKKHGGLDEAGEKELKAIKGITNIRATITDIQEAVKSVLEPPKTNA